MYEKQFVMIQEAKMNNFNLCVPTDIRFGKGQIECLPGELRKYGSRVLLVYGGGSIKRSGLYDKVIQLLAKQSPPQQRWA